MNLELGGGPVGNKRYGYTSMDHLAWSGATDIVADISEPWPLADECVDDIYSCHVLEHVSWRKLITTITESYRVLKHGKRATHIWPEFGRIMALWQWPCTCVNFKTFRADPNCPICHGKGKVHPARIKSDLCGGQEYDGDVHLNILLEQELIGYLVYAGFEIENVATLGHNPACCRVVAVKP